MMGRVLLLTLLLPLLCAGFGAGAQAQAGSFCLPGLLANDNIYFGGDINILSGAAVDGVGSTQISCRNLRDGQVIRVCLGSSQSSPRTLANNTYHSSLNYEIFTNERRDSLFVPVTQSDVFIDLSKTSPTAKFNFYGRIFENQQSASVGDYYANQRDFMMRLIFFDGIAPSGGCAAAGSNSGTLSVGLGAGGTVIPNCSISNIQDMIFPRQTIFTGDVTEQAPAQFTVKCTTDAPYAIGLDDGLNARNGRCPSSSQRCMVSRQNPAHRIDYDLYDTNQRLSRWGATDPLAVGAGSKPRRGRYVGETITVYGKIPKPTLSPAPGDYSDTIIVTLNF